MVRPGLRHGLPASIVLLTFLLLVSLTLPSVGLAGSTPSTTTIQSSLNPSGTGVAVTFTATVTGSAGTPTGTVSFQDVTARTTPICAPAPVTGGQAQCTTSNLSVGSRAIRAAYVGDTTYAASNGDMTQVVKYTTSTTITNDLSTPTVVGQAYSVAFQVANVTEPAAPPFGTVTVSDGSSTCSKTTSTSTGSCSLVSTTAGVKTVTATYVGNSDFLGSTSSGTPHTVSKITTTTSVVSDRATSSNPTAIVGEAVTFTATVTVSGGGSPTGVVTFKDGATTLGTGTVSSGQATYTTSSLARGSHSITAEYGGDASYSASTSDAITQWVTATTRASVSTMDAYSDGGHTYVQWETTSEAGTVGFYLYRQDGATGEFRLVSTDLLPAFFSTHVGATYRLRDPSAELGGTYVYKLGEIERDGRQIVLGPYSVEVVPDHRPPLGRGDASFTRALHPSPRPLAADRTSWRD